MSQVAVGVDIGKGKFDVARLCEGKYRHKKFDNNPQGFAASVAWLEGFGDDRPWICWRPRSLQRPLGRVLGGQGYRVSVVNPRHASVATHGTASPALRRNPPLVFHGMAR